MAATKINDTLEASVINSGNVLSLKLAYISTRKPLASASDTVENLHQCLEKLLEGNTEIELSPIQRAMSTPYPIKLAFSNDEESGVNEGTLLHLVRTAFNAGLDVAKLKPMTKMAPAAAGLTQVDPAKIERGFDAALDMGDDLGNMSPIRLAAFFYNITLDPSVDLRKAAREFIADNQYQSADHAINQAAIDAMVKVGTDFIASEQKLITR